MTINQAIKQARKMRGLTQEQAGDIIGCSKQLISQYELGQIEPTVRQAQKFITAYGIRFLLGPDSIELIRKTQS